VVAVVGIFHVLALALNLESTAVDMIKINTAVAVLVGLMLLGIALSAVTVMVHMPMVEVPLIRQSLLL
jgi:hypothetical protein